MEKMTEQEGGSLNVLDENIATMKKIFPEAFTEEKVDFDTLRQLLGDALDDGDEKFGLNWFGKQKARQISLQPSLGTLRPCQEESVNWDTAQNLFIEGDNLEVLKLLQKGYAGKIKVIYIDPPYNTGKEFIYPDKFQDNLDTYLRYTGQKDDEGMKFSSNTESSGRYHTNWLNMMYPRLKLARSLMSNDGVIAITVDDNELFQLGKVMDEIFGDTNRLACAPWLSEASGGKEKTGLRTGHEYILLYFKSSSINITQEERSTGDLNLKDNKGKYRKGRELMKWGGDSLRSDRPHQFYDLPAPDGTRVFPYRNDGQDGHWRWGKANENSKKAQLDHTVLHWEKRPFNEGVEVLGRRERWVPYEKIRDVKKSVGWSTWLDKFGTNADATRELKALFGFKPFDTPKPVSLIKWIVNLHEDEEAIVLDFFAGSASTAHAVMDLNSEDGGYRKYICVQLPEPLKSEILVDKINILTVADIGKERIRRAAAKIREENPDYEGDLGFKLFKLDSSNIRAWNPDRHDLEQTLLDHKEHLVSGRTEQDVLYELLLKRGVDLAAPIEEKTIADKTVYSIGYGALFACLNSTINREDVEAVAQGIIAWHKELAPASDTQIVFRDSAFADDIAKTNMTAILEQNGIAHVRSL